VHFFAQKSRLLKPIFRVEFALVHEKEPALALVQLTPTNNCSTATFEAAVKQLLGP